MDRHTFALVVIIALLASVSIIVDVLTLIEQRETTRSISETIQKEFSQYEIVVE